MRAEVLVLTDIECYSYIVELMYIVVVQLPVNLLRAGRVFVFEPPPGVRANLLRTFSTLPPSRMSRVSNATVSITCTHCVCVSVGMSVGGFEVCFIY